MAIGIGISIANNRVGASAPSLGSTMATTHYNRVIADGGVVPAGISGLTTILDLVVAAYGATSSSDFNTKVPVFLDPHYTGYKLGAGSGTTLGQAARTVYAISSTADVTQATAASQPLLLAHSGVNYWWGSGVSGNYVSTPNAAANQITGDIEIICKFTTPPDMTSTSLYSIIGKWDSGTNPSACSYLVITNDSTNTINFAESNGISVRVLSASITWAANTEYYFKVVSDVNDGLGNNIRYIYRSTDNGLNWILLASNTQVGIYVRNNPNRFIEAGSLATGGNGVLKGRIYRATIANSIGGSPVVDFNPASYSASTSQTAWTSSTGEVWTINTGTATTGYKGMMVDRTILQGDGIDDGLLTSGTISLPTVFTLYSAFKGYNNEAGNGKVVFGKQNIDGAVTRYSATNLAGWIGSGGSGSVVQQTATVANLNLATFKRKVSSNTLQVNNGTIATSINSNAIANSSITLFSVTTYGFCNGLFSTGLVSSLEDDTTQKTALYNTIRSMNNNAF